METQNRTVTVAVITGIVALLLGCCLGALVAGVGGYALGRQAAAPQMIAPVAPIMPQMPGLPDLPDFQTPRMAGISGARIQEVVSGAPADTAGLKVGDVITAVDSTPLDENHSLADIIGQYKPGAELTLRVWRVNETLTLKVKLGANPNKAGQGYLGVRYVDFSMLRDAPTAPSD